MTIFRGSRSFTLFLTDEQPTLTLNFVNEFNAYDTLSLTALTKRKLSFDRSTAFCCGKSSFYDDKSEVEYETTTSALSYPVAKYLTQALQSPTIILFSPDFPLGISALIADIESELSNATIATSSVKFKWKPKQQQPSLSATKPNRIFTSPYNNTFD